jgi:photosystem II cytochrome c550
MNIITIGCVAALVYLVGPSFLHIIGMAWKTSQKTALMKEFGKEQLKKTMKLLEDRKKIGRNIKIASLPSITLGFPSDLTYSEDPFETEKKGKSDLGGSFGVELDEDIRTVRFSDGSPENRAYPLELVLTRAQVKRGKFLFNKACAYCHVAGLTKPDPNVGLDLESLSKAVPPRDSILGLVKFLKEPRTYDGVSSLVETHPSASRRGAYLFPVVRTLTEKDLVALAGHMLIQPKILNERWGGGKIYY